MMNNIHSFKISLLSTDDNKKYSITTSLLPSEVDKKYYATKARLIKRERRLRSKIVKIKNDNFSCRYPAYKKFPFIPNDQKINFILGEKMKYKKLLKPLPLIIPNLINIKKDARGLDGAPVVDWPVSAEWPVSAKSLKKGSIQVVKGGSTIDFILEKSSCEMSDFFD